MSPVLSIIVPVYNVEKYLCQCIDSILDQTFTDYELILVNDGSKDNCPAICDEYATKDSRIKVIHKENGGLVSARKAGLDISVGEYIGFVDSDDWIDSDMYEKLYNAIQKGVDIAICDIYLNYPEKEVVLTQENSGFHNKESLINNIYPKMLYKEGYYVFGVRPSVCNKIFKKDLILRHLPYIDNKVAIGEDAACTFPCMLDSNSVYILEDCPLYHYRQNRLSMTKSYMKNYFESNILLFSYLKESFQSQRYIMMESQLNYYVVYLTIAALLNEMNDKNKKRLFNKIQHIHKNISLRFIKNAFNSIDIKRLPRKYRVYVISIRFKFIYLLIFRLWSKNKVKKIGYLLKNLNGASNKNEI